MEIQSKKIGQTRQTLPHGAKVGRFQIAPCANTQLKGPESLIKSSSLMENSAWVADISSNKELPLIQSAPTAGTVLASGICTLAEIIVDGAAEISSVDEDVINQFEAAFDNLDLQAMGLSREDQTDILKMKTLALDVLRHPEKSRGFVDDEGGSFGKKDTRNQLSKYSKKFSHLLKKGSIPAEGSEDSEKFNSILTGVGTAIKIVSGKLNKARSKKALSYTAKSLYTAATIAGCAATSGVALIPELIRTGATVLGSANDVAMSELESHENAKNDVPQFNVFETQVPGLKEENRAYLKRMYHLASDVLRHPEKSKEFVDGEGGFFGKKDTRNQLRDCLDNFDALLGPANGRVFDIVHRDIEAAKRVVSEKLNRARAMKAMKVGAAVTGIIAAVAGSVVTFGAGTIAIPAAICSAVSLLSAATSGVKTTIELSKSEE
jgi:enamine deaminase RidA (YjgF/YER057c/UK114 family)